jgi:hypothetical protein
MIFKKKNQNLQLKFNINSYSIFHFKYINKIYKKINLKINKFTFFFFEEFEIQKIFFLI